MTLNMYNFGVKNTVEHQQLKRLLLSANSRATGGFFSEPWRAGLPEGVSCRLGDDLAVGESGCRGDKVTC